MSENESREKRTTTDQETEPNKKQKLTDEVNLTPALPILSNTLVLDKVQEDTINQLVQSSSVVNGNFYIFARFIFLTHPFSFN